MLHQLIILSLAGTLLASCGEATNPVPSLASLAGSSWTGNYEQISGEQTADAAKVKLDFRSDSSLQIAPLEARLTGMVKGTYKDMPRNKVMMFDFVESTLDLIGKSHTQQNFKYEMAGEELVLSGANGNYYLVKEGSSSDGKAEDEKPLEGDWSCTPSASARWSMNLSGSSFRGSRSERGSRTLYFEGQVDYLSESAGEATTRLNVKSSNYPALVGVVLAFEQVAESKAALQQLDDNSKPVGQQIQCSR